MAAITVPAVSKRATYCALSVPVGIVPALAQCFIIMETEKPLNSIKELVNEAAHSTLNDQLAAERDHFVRNLHHTNAGIGIAAFLNKQTPRYE